MAFLLLQFKTPLKDNTAEILKKRLVPDTLLHNHFNRKINKLINRFGKKKMAKEVEKLKAATDKIRKKCDLKESPPESLKKGFNRPYSRKVSLFLEF